MPIEKSDRQNGTNYKRKIKSKKAINLQYFRRNVIGRAAKSRCQLVLIHSLLAHTEVGYFTVALAVQQNIVQLEVSVNDAILVQKHERQRYFGRVESGPILVEFSRSLNLKHQIATVHKLHHKIQPVLQTRCINILNKFFFLSKKFFWHKLTRKRIKKNDYEKKVHDFFLIIW